VVAIFCGRILEGRPVTIYGDGGQTRDYVYVADVVRANVAALESTVSGAFNVGTGVETSVNQLYDALAGNAGTSRAAEFGPPRAGEQRRSVILPERAAKELGWRPQVELSNGLAQTLRFFRDRAAR
jgi:UDP-glucose 4-epimerase